MKRSPLRRAGPETIRIGLMEFTLPAGLSRARRRAFVAAAEQHVLERGEITVAEANRLLRDREARMARALGTISKRDRPVKLRTKYARRPRDLARMAWVKTLPCAMAQMEQWRLRRDHPDGDRLLGLWLGPLAFTGCRGVMEAHHAGERGKGQKAPDDTCIPMCYAHHRGDDIGITRYRGPFADWPRGAVKAWELAMVEIYQRRYAEHVAGRDAAIY